MLIVKIIIRKSENITTLGLIKFLKHSVYSCEIDQKSVTIPFG